MAGGKRAVWFYTAAWRMNVCMCVGILHTCMNEAQMVLVRWFSMVDEGSKLCTLVIVLTWSPLLPACLLSLRMCVSFQVQAPSTVWRVLIDVECACTP